MITRTRYGNDGEGSAQAPSADTDFLAAVKSWMRADGYTGEDAVIKSAIDAAFGLLCGIDGATHRTLIESAYTLTIDRFPCGPIVLPLPPVTSVTALTYIDVDGAEQTLVEDTDFRVTRKGSANFHARLVPLKGWPSVYAFGDAVSVDFVAGQAGVPSELPALVQDVAKTLAAHRYRYRDEPVAMPEGPAFRGLIDAISSLEVV